MPPPPGKQVKSAQFLTKDTENLEGSEGGDRNIDDGLGTSCGNGETKSQRPSVGLLGWFGCWV